MSEFTPHPYPSTLAIRISMLFNSKFHGLKKIHFSIQGHQMWKSNLRVSKQISSVQKGIVNSLEKTSYGSLLCNQVLSYKHTKRESKGCIEQSFHWPDFSELLAVAGVVEQPVLTFALSLEEPTLGLFFVASSALTFLACLLPL